LLTFDIAKDVGMLPIVLHQNNLQPMYEKWLHGEQAKWWTHAKRFDILDWPVLPVNQDPVLHDHHAGQPGGHQLYQQGQQLQG
jgi:hypothetical protein